VIQLSGEPETQLLLFARRWCAIAANDLAAALAMLDEPNHYGLAWTDERVRSLLAETLSEQATFSLPETARGGERHHFGRVNDGSYWLDYDVPLNGEFSDLTAQFEFHPRNGDSFAVVLHDLHVM